jgi:hypothetical protein
MTVKANVNLLKHTLKLTLNAAGRYSISFDYDALEPVRVLVFFVCRETFVQEGNNHTKYKY